MHRGAAVFAAFLHNCYRQRNSNGLPTVLLNRNAALLMHKTLPQWF